MAQTTKTYSRKSLLFGPLLLTLVITGCAGIEPYEARDHREEGPEKGLFSGSDGEFVIYKKVDEPETGNESSKKEE